MSNPTLSAQATRKRDNAKATPTSRSRSHRQTQIGYYVLTRTYNMFAPDDPCRKELKRITDSVKAKSHTFSWAVIYEALAEHLQEKPNWTNEQFSVLLSMLRVNTPISSPVNKALFNIVKDYAERYKPTAR